MKKVVKLISLFILLLIINVGVVRAAVTVNKYDSGFRRLNGYFAGEEIDRYQAQINNQTVDIYCHNPGVNPYQESDFDSEKGLELKTLRNLSNPGENNRLQNVYDAGLMYITSNKCGKDIVSDNCYVRNYIAVNMYEQLFPTMNTNGSNSNAQIKYLKWIIKNNFASLEGDLKTLNRLIGSAFGVITSEPSTPKSNPCSENCDTFGEYGQTENALKLVKKALKEAIKYAQETNSNRPTISMTKGAQSKKNNGNNSYSSTISHTIKIVKFGKKAETTEDGKTIKPSAIVSFECKNDACNNATKKFTLKGGSLKEAKTYSIDELQKLNLVSLTDNNGTGTFELKVAFTGKNCDTPIDYALNLKYTQYLLTFTSGYSVSKCTNSNKCQGFYVEDPISASGTKTITLENNLNLCKNDDTDTCLAKIDNVSCITCEEGRNKIEIKEGYDYTNANVCNITDANQNITKCIANDGAKDASGHSYKNTELSAKTSNANVGVYCMENYTLDFPGSIVTAPIRTFTLDPSIEGTQTCVTNKIDGLENVKTEMKKKATETVNNYNSYIILQARYDCLKGNTSCDMKLSNINKIPTNDCQTSYYYSNEVDKDECALINGSAGNPDGPIEKCYENNNHYYQNRYGLTKCKYIAEATFSYTYTPKSTYTSNCEALGSVSQTSYRTIQVPIDNYYSDDEAEDKIDEYINSIIDRLKAKIGEEATIRKSSKNGPKGTTTNTYDFKIGDGVLGHLSLGVGGIAQDAYNWNNATGYYAGNIDSDENAIDKTPFIDGWKMNYNFAPTMKFWYQESYMKKARTNDMDRKLNIENLDTKFCMGDIDSKTYECKTGWKDAPETESLSLCVCDKNGCGKKSFELSKVKYSKQTQTATAKFITPTQFYSLSPSGGVVVGEPGQSSKIPNSIEETNKLVISPNTVGTRRYTLWIENLGDYFNNDKLGRIWGESDSVVPQLLKNRASCDANNDDVALVVKDTLSGVNNGAYVCKYTTDCPTENKCNWNNGNPICSDGEICTTDEYYKQCTSCGVNNPDLPPLIENEKYTYCDYLPLGSANATYQCRIKVDKTQYNNDCKPSLPTYYKCGNPQIKNNKYYYFADESLKIYRDGVSAEQYYKDCTSCGINKPELKPEIKNDLYYYYHQTFDYSKGMVGFKNGVDYNQYKTDCCPDCPPSINYSCAVPYEETINGEVKYTYRINGINKIRVSADERNKDCPSISCNKTTNEKGDTIYYGKDGQITDEKTYKTQCCPNGDCPITCTYCLYDGNKLNIQYRPITSEDLNPNNRELGINWQWDNNIDTTMELKAYVTTDEIEETGDEIFNLDNSDFNNKTDNNDSFAMKVTMDANLISKLRSINKNKKFMTNTLKCYDYKDENDNAIYENIYCYSTVIDDILNDPKTKNNIVFTVERPLESERDKNNVNEKYFTNFISKTATEWKLGTGISLAIADTAQNKYGIEIDRTTGKMTDYHVGPSWK